jgi:hypothetical protein
MLSVMLLLWFAEAQAPARQPGIRDGLRQARFALHLENGVLSGPGAAVLESAIHDAQYVLIGEDHVTREIPQFAAAVCDIMAPQGLSTMAVETGPQAAEFVSSSFGKPDRLTQMKELLRKYPDSIAFLNIRQENDLVAHCAEMARHNHFQLWGLDQEFLGSAGWLLDRILATHPGPSAVTAITKLKSQEEHDAARAMQTGDTSNLFLLSASDSELHEVAAVLQREGNATANLLFRELIDSHEIYVKNRQGLPESNHQRARLLKQNFLYDFEAMQASHSEGKILIKFGDWHLYKGINPIQQRDLGNYVAELADGQRSNSLHICVLGAKGTHREYDAYGRPTRLSDFVLDEDRDYRWLKPAIDAQLLDSWTLYDLRKLRFQSLGNVDPDLERLIYGYDLLIIIPEVTPADLIE